MWKNETHELWKMVGNRSLEDGTNHVLKSRRGFGYVVCIANVRPSNLNTATRDLSGNGVLNSLF